MVEEGEYGTYVVEEGEVAVCFVEEGVADSWVRNIVDEGRHERHELVEWRHVRSQLKPEQHKRELIMEFQSGSACRRDVESRK